jgi:hypothetical protein
MAADRVFRIAVVLTSPSVVPAARGPVALIRSWSRVMAQGDEREPGRGARMPPGLKDGFPDGRDAGRVHGDPGRSGAGDGRQRGSSSGDWALERRVGQSCAVSDAGAQEGGAAWRVRISIPPSR